MAVFDINGDVISSTSSVSGIVSVKDYGAKGDGETNDSSAIQSALDALKNTGGIIVFPIGTYILYSSVAFYSNQFLLFENGATLKAGNGTITNLLISSCLLGTTGYDGVHDSVIYGATFDGGAQETNITLAGIVHSKNVIFERCTFKNAYGAWHNLEINSSYNCKVINCDFEGSRKNSSNACLIQVDSIDSAATWPWEDNRGSIDNTISKYTEILGSVFHDDTISPAIGNHSSTNIQYLKIHDCVFTGLTTERAAVAFQSGKYVDIYDNTFVGCTTICSDTSGSNWTCHDNRIDGATSIGGFAAKYNNIVDGTLSS